MTLLSNQIVTHIITENHLNDDDYVGAYDISKHNETITYKGQKYTYHNSGLCRSVYRSLCGKFVIKTPTDCDIDTKQEYEDMMDAIKNRGKTYFVPISVNHNLYEYEAYAEAPPQMKKYLAKTDLLPNGWIKQEFVRVKKVPLVFDSSKREVGITKEGNYVIFDFDPFLKDFNRPTVFDYTWLPSFIENVKKQLC